MKVYTIAEQERIVRTAWPQSQHRLIAKLHRDGGRLLALGIQRLKGIGHEDYGDSLFHKSIDEVDREVDMELADAFVYEGAYHLLDQVRKGIK